MQALVATLDAGLYASVATVLGLSHPGIVTRRAYNGPEVRALLEGEVFVFVCLDTAMNGYGRDFSADALASRYPQAQFCLLGDAAGLPLGSVPTQAVVPPPQGVMDDSCLRTTGLVEVLHPVEQMQQRGRPEGPPLTGRQRDVLRLVREARSTKEMARQLGLAVPTVKTHLAALYRQLGVRNRVEAAMTDATPAALRVSKAIGFGDAPVTRASHLRAVG